MSAKKKAPRIRRVLVSGGPAAGKTAVLEIVKRHLTDHVAVIPEAATILFSGGLPRRREKKALRVIQRAIFQLQKNTEELFATTHPRLAHVCDRGALDGAAYWPGGLKDFLRAMKTTLAREYARYDAVIFLESTAYDVKSWPNDNPHRIESPLEAARLDRKLRKILAGHPKFHFVPHAQNFYEKVAVCLITLHRILSGDGKAPADLTMGVSIPEHPTPRRSR